MNIKKFTFIMAIAMVAMLAFGGTYAYFTATTNAQSDSVATGKVSLKTGTALELVDGPVVPGQELLKNATITYTNESTVATYIFVEFTAEVKETANADEAIDVANALSHDLLTQGWLAVGGTYTNVYYKEAPIATEENKTYTVATSIKLAGDINYNEGTFDANNSTIVDSEDNKVDIENKFIVVNVKASSIQTLDNNGDPFDTALLAYQALIG